MYAITQWFYNQETEKKNNIYKTFFMELLEKRKNKLFTISDLIQAYSLKTKKKLSEILVDKDEINSAISLIKLADNILQYYYIKNNMIYNVFSYCTIPVYRDKNNCSINIEEDVDNLFYEKFTLDNVKDLIAEPKKYINFDFKNISIDGNNILKNLILTKEEDLLDCLIDRFNIQISDDDVEYGITYLELLNTALAINNSNIVNLLNKHYYETKYETNYVPSNESYNVVNYVTITSSILNIVLTPFVLYVLVQSQC
jgi:hypothetical protein